MTTGHVALVVEGFAMVIGPAARTDAAVLQCIKSTVTGVQYAFYSQGTKDVQLQFDLWMERFVRERETYHMQNRKSSGKDKKKTES